MGTHAPSHTIGLLVMFVQKIGAQLFGWSMPGSLGRLRQHAKVRNATAIMEQQYAQSKS
jgi:hypothetical protein